MLEKIELDAVAFANERMEAIKEIEREIKKTKKNKMLFQCMPFHKRRRTASFDERRLPKALRRGSRFVKRRKRARKWAGTEEHLRTHVWFAKRFSMVKVWGTRLPNRRAHKSDKFIHCSLKTRGLLYDESYKKKFVIRGSMEAAVLPEALRGVDASLHGETQNIFFVEAGLVREKGEVCVFRDFALLFVHGGDGHILSLLRERMEVIEIERRLALFRLMGRQKVYAKTGVVEEKKRGVSSEPVVREVMSLEALSRVLEVLGEKEKENEAKKCEEHAFIYLSGKGGDMEGRILCPVDSCMYLLEKLVVKGVVPCSITELFRAALEREGAVYPFDFLSTGLSREYRTAIASELGEKYERTPVGKRCLFYGSVLPHSVLYTEKRGVALGGDEEEHQDGLFIAKFVAEKGAFDANSHIVIQKNDCDSFDALGTEASVGHVIRSGFSFTKGVTAGICALEKIALPQGSAFFIRSLRSTKFRRASITRLGFEDVI